MATVAQAETKGFKNRLNDKQRAQAKTLAQRTLAGGASSGITPSGDAAVNSIDSGRAIVTESESKASSDQREELYLVKEHIKLLSEKMDRAAEKAGTDDGKKTKPWWTTLVEILGIPAVVVAILLQVSQITAGRGTPEKTIAETEKIKVESLKTRAELEGLLNDLADKKQVGVAAYKAQIEETLPKLEATLQKLRDIEQKSHESTQQRLLV